MRDLRGVSHSDMANAVRFLSADAVERAGSGHPGMPMGMADVATVLFSKVLKFDAKCPEWPDRDRFVLSAGHGSMLLYSLLHLCDFPWWDLSAIKSFRQLGSIAAGHPEYGHGPGIETTTGPLGQGIATAVGMALAEEMDRARFGEDLVSHYTYVIAGDGCLMEGISQEAITLAGHLGLSRLVVLYDDNQITIDGSTSLATSEDQHKRFEAAGWDTFEVDGHDPEAVEESMLLAKASNRPAMVVCKTRIGFGAPSKSGSAKSHGSPLGSDEISGARLACNWPHSPFEIPDDIREAWRLIGARGGADRMDWELRLNSAPSQQRALFNDHQARRFPVGWDDALLTHKCQVSQKASATSTRKASGAALEVLTNYIPNLIGGSADLTGSVNTLTSSTVAIAADDFTGRYIHYGVREHAMAAVMNGLSLHGGYFPYAGTFLVFANYFHPALRLACLMKLPMVHVLTHDSIGLGEDGPTHQPVETLAILRATPDLVVLRPADAVETAEAWDIALKRTEGPTALVLSRQDLPILRLEADEQNKSSTGGYVLSEAACGERLVSLIATGSEVSIACEAREILEAEGIPTAVISLPSFELFRATEAKFKSDVLGDDGVLKIGIEAALEFGWREFLGGHGAFVGMTGYGASAPANDLYKHFGITAQAVCERVRGHLSGRSCNE